MMRYKEWSRRKKGVAGIIAATFLFAMIFTTGFAYFMFVQYNYKLQHQAAIERNQMDFEQNLEQFVVSGSVSDNYLYARVNNTGPVAITIVQVFFFDADTGEFISEGEIPKVTINPGATVTIESYGIPYSSGNRLIKVVTERGNSEVGFYPPPKLDYITVNALYATLAKGIGSIHIEFASLRWMWAEMPSYLSGWGWAPNGVDQSGYLANGYNGHATVYNKNVVFLVNVTNYDPDGRDIYLNGNSELRYLTITGGGSSFKIDRFPLAKGYSLTNHTVIRLKSWETIKLPFNETVTICFGDTDTSIADKDVLGPFLSLFGKYSDGKPYAQTLAFEGTIPISSNYYVKLYDTPFANPKYKGVGGDKVSIEFSGEFKGKTVMIGLIKRNGVELLLNTISVPSSSPYRVSNAFTVPSPSSLGGTDYYVFYATDGRNVAYSTFYVY